MILIKAECDVKYYCQKKNKINNNEHTHAPK